MNTRSRRCSTAGCRGARTQRVAAAAEPQRLAGLDLHAPEDLLDAGGLERGLDVVVRADRDAAGDDQHVALQAALDRGQRRVAVVGDHALVGHVGAGAARRAARPSARWTRGCGPARAARRAAAAPSPVTARCSRGPAVHGDLADARGGQRGQPRDRQPLAGADQHVAGAQVLAAHAYVRAGLDRALGRHVAVGDLGQLGLQDRVGAGRHRRAGGDRRRRCPAPARPWRPRRRPRRPPAAARRRARCRRSARRSRPSPSGRTAAGRRRRRRPRRRSARRRRPAAPTRTPAARSRRGSRPAPASIVFIRRCGTSSAPAARSPRR